MFHRFCLVTICVILFGISVFTADRKASFVSAVSATANPSVRPPVRQFLLLKL